MEKLRFALLMVAAVAALAVGETFISRGMKQSGRASSGFSDGARAAVTNPWVVSGVILMALHLGLYATALSVADLSLVMPMTAATYPVVAMLSRFYLHEEVHQARWVGV